MHLTWKWKNIHDKYYKTWGSHLHLDFNFKSSKYLFKNYILQTNWIYGIYINMYIYIIYVQSYTIVTLPFPSKYI